MTAQTDTFSEISGGEASEHPSEVVLRCRGLRVNHRGKTVLAGLDLDILKGEVVALIIDSEWEARLVPRVFIGMKPADRGKIILNGTDLAKLSEYRKLRLRRDVGYMFHNSGLIYNLSVWYNVALPALYHTRFKDLQGVGEHVDLLLKRCGLTEWRNQRPAALDKATCKVVALARAWMLSPPLLIFEDPLMGIDSGSGSDLLNMALGPPPPEWVENDPRPPRPGVLITSQGLHEGLFRYMDRIIIIEKGEVVFTGDPKEFDRRGKSHPGDLIDRKEAF